MFKADDKIKVTKVAQTSHKSFKLYNIITSVAEISSGDRSLEVSKRRLSCSDVSVNFPAHNATATNITANCPNYPAVIGSNP